MICQFNNVSVSLGKNDILRNLDWEIAPGEVVGLLGKNGAGKSTLIQTLLGLIKPSQGEIKTLGCLARNISDHEKSRIGFVPQTSVGYEGMKVGHAIDLHRRCYQRWDDDLVKRMLDRFQLPLDGKVHKLSVGQRQSFMLVLALASKPEFLVMDEPVASLDPSARRDVLQFIAEAADQSCTILYSTHITADINRLADKVAMLEGGKIQFSKPCDELSQSVLIHGHIDKADLPTSDLRSRILKTTDAYTLVCGMDDEFKHHVPSDILVQPLNLEELFIRWHALCDDRVLA